jgi:flavorubredoxin
VRTTVHQIADRIYRLSTWIPNVGPGGFTFNQFLIDAEEPLLYHTGMRQLFPLVKEAVEQVMPVSRLRWIAFAHMEADECGSVNEFLAVAPHAQVVHGELGVQMSLNDYCARPPRPMADGEILDIGDAMLTRQVQELSTPHVPHNWESHMFFETETRTLFCSDLLAQLGNGPALTSDDLIEAACMAETTFQQTSLGPAIPLAYRRLAALEPNCLAIMHGSSYEGDCARLLRTMADIYEQRFGCQQPESARQLPGHTEQIGTKRAMDGMVSAVPLLSPGRARVW